MKKSKSQKKSGMSFCMSFCIALQRRLARIQGRAKWELTSNAEDRR